MDLVADIEQQLREHGSAQHWTTDERVAEDWRQAARSAARRLKRRVMTMRHSDCAVAFLQD